MRIVVVHGAFSSAAVWELVLPGLRAAGHDAEAIDLPGAGQDRTPVGEVTLQRYGERVVEALGSSPPDAPPLLVGHSMGGMAVTQAAALAPDRVRALAYVAAFLPVAGESLIDLTHRPEAGQDQVQANLVVSGDPPVATLTPEGARIAINQLATEEQAAWADARRGPQPVLPFTQPLVVPEESAQAFAALPRAYITTLQDRAIWPELQRFMATRAGCDPIIEIDTDHSVWLTATDELVAALDQVARTLG